MRSLDTLMTMYDDTQDFDGWTVGDMLTLVEDLLKKVLPLPTDLIAKLEEHGVYIRT